MPPGCNRGTLWPKGDPHGVSRRRRFHKGTEVKTTSKSSIVKFRFVPSVPVQVRVELPVPPLCIWTAATGGAERCFVEPEQVTLKYYQAMVSGLIMLIWIFYRSTRY